LHHRVRPHHSGVSDIPLPNGTKCNGKTLIFIRRYQSTLRLTEHIPAIRNVTAAI
jgi:hypothetical protein